VESRVGAVAASRRKNDDLPVAVLVAVQGMERE